VITLTNSYILHCLSSVSNSHHPILAIITTKAPFIIQAIQSIIHASFPIHYLNYLYFNFAFPVHSNLLFFFTLTDLQVPLQAIIQLDPYYLLILTIVPTIINNQNVNFR